MAVTLRDKFILLFLAFLLTIYGGYKAMWIPTNTKIAELEKQKENVKGQAGDIKPLLEKSEALKNREKALRSSVNNIKELSGGLTMTNEEFLVFLGKTTEKNNVQVSGFNDLGVVNTDGIYRSIFDFELKGNSVDINKVLEDINNIGIKCSYGSVSYRQNEQYDYLKRFFDDLSDLPWYKEPKEDDKKDNIPQPSAVPVIPEMPSYTPVPDFDYKYPEEPIVPEEPKSQPEPTEIPEKNDDTPKNLEDRLNDLLEQTSYTRPYRIMLLANDGIKYKSGQNMQLAVTVCFIMYNEPSEETSILKTGNIDNAVL